jgi:hypothetical protein
MPENEMIEAKIERQAGDFPVFGEAVHDAADPVGALLLQYRAGVIGRRRACARPAACPRRLPHGYGGESGRAAISGGPSASGSRDRSLATAITFGCPASREYLFVRFFDIGIFGMNANGRVEVGMGFSQRQNTGKVLEIDPDTYRQPTPFSFMRPESPEGAARDRESRDGNGSRPASSGSEGVGRGVDCMTPPSRPSILRRASWPLSSLLK